MQPYQLLHQTISFAICFCLINCYKLAKDLWCLSAPFRQHDLLEKPSLLLWSYRRHASVWLTRPFPSNEISDVAESVFVNRNALRSIFHFIQPFCTLRCSTNMNWNSWWRCPRSSCAGDLSLCTCHCACMIELGPSLPNNDLVVISNDLNIYKIKLL